MDDRQRPHRTAPRGRALPVHPPRPRPRPDLSHGTENGRSFLQICTRVRLRDGAETAEGSGWTRGPPRRRRRPAAGKSPPRAPRPLPRSLRPARLDRRARHGFRGNAALPDAGRAAVVSLVWPSDPVLSCQPTGCARIRDAVTGEKHPILATRSFQDPEACSPLGGSRLSPADTEKSPSQPQTGHTTTWTVVGKGAAGVSVLQVF